MMTRKEKKREELFLFKYNSDRYIYLYKRGKKHAQLSTTNSKWMDELWDYSSEKLNLRSD